MERVPIFTLACWRKDEKSVVHIANQCIFLNILISLHSKYSIV